MKFSDWNHLIILPISVIPQVHAILQFLTAVLAASQSAHMSLWNTDFGDTVNFLFLAQPFDGLLPLKVKHRMQA